jgi:hypothetical protein
LLAYLIILAATVAGMMQVSWLAAPVCACLLALLLALERYNASLSPSGLEDAAGEPFATMTSLANGSMAATAAFLLGRATGWLWGI